ncbi:uncharacterized protein LOC62_04G005271 [Vanrija pseudolonga]|uniref:Uncharacterized protein n=1 Tax=Vanrija pseudolonga TaxID=143232 RepID=A0AAF1BL44_9TREE|nr:hypothetical protein LOC62_04G005271 [Vanrija pseudolonga]
MSRGPVWLDSTAYPHLIERIIALAPSVTALVAWRQTCWRYHAVADRYLFAHAVLQRQYLFPLKPVAKLLTRMRRQVVVKLDKRYDKYRTYSGFVLLLPPDSRLELDRPLPFYPWKARVLDIEAGGDYVPWDFVRRGMWDNVTMTEDKAPPYVPDVLRRLGSCASDGWASVRDTAVDWVTAGQPEGECSIYLPSSTPRYILHLAAPPGASGRLTIWPPTQRIGEVVIVLAGPVGAPVVAQVVAGMMRMLVREAGHPTALTIVGVESDTEAFRAALTTEVLALGGYAGPGVSSYADVAPDEASVRHAIGAISFVPRAE